MWNVKVEWGWGGLPGGAYPGLFSFKHESKGGLTLLQKRVTPSSQARVILPRFGGSVVLRKELGPVLHLPPACCVTLGKSRCLSGSRFLNWGETSGFLHVLCGAPDILRGDVGVPVGATCGQLSLHTRIQPEWLCFV